MITTTLPVTLLQVQIAETTLDVAAVRRARFADAVVKARGSFRIREAAEALVEADDILWEAECAYNAILMDYYGEPGM